MDYAYRHALERLLTGNCWRLGRCQTADFGEEKAKPNSFWSSVMLVLWILSKTVSPTPTSPGSRFCRLPGPLVFTKMEMPLIWEPLDFWKDYYAPLGLS